MTSSVARSAPWNALIRTHHITSRKKVSKLKQAASGNDVFALLRSGGAPGIMYVEGSKTGVEEWVMIVQKLRYKDFQLVSRPAQMVRDPHGSEKVPLTADRSGLVEIDTVKDFGLCMQQRGLLDWWRKGMGYAGSDDRL